MHRGKLVGGAACLATALLAVTGGRAMAQRALSTDHFANVFTEREGIVVRAAAGAPGEVAVRDVDGREVLRRDAGAGEATLDLGALPPGYYEAVAGTTTLPIAVVVDPAKRWKGDSRLAMDNAMSWLVPAAQFDSVAELVRLAGIGWVRERLSWGEVQPTRGAIDWGKYDRSATALAGRGINVYQIFHASPGWARADHDQAAPPDDLRDAYRFAQALAREFKGRVRAWEVWNEPDISFFSQPASECAAFQKAAFLGFRSVDASQLVLGPSMSQPAGSFADHLLSSGAGDYMDVWNYHIYADPSFYASRTQGFRELLAKHGVNHPYWVTEAGDPVPGPGGVLTHQSRLHQAAFLSRAYAQALAAGIDRHFWFVFPFYREGETGWGLFEPDQRAPFPAYAALSTATYMMGKGDYLGSLPLGDAQARAFAFARGDGRVAVDVWRESDTRSEVKLPLDWKDVVEARTHVGTPVDAGSGPVSLTVGRAATWLLLARAPAGLAAPARPAAPKPSPARGLHDVIVRLRVNGARVDKNGDQYIVNAGQTVAAQAEVYNFGSRPVSGSAELRVPAGWRTDHAKAAATVPAGERAIVPVKLTAPPHYAVGDVALTFTAGGSAVTAPAVVTLSVDPASAATSSSRPLGVDRPGGWRKNIAGHGAMEIAAGAQGGVRFTFTFSGAGDSWAYPEWAFSPAVDLSAYDGLRFEYRTDPGEMGVVRVMVGEPDGADYMTSAGLPGSAAWKTATVLFRDLSYLGSSKPDPNGKLDLNRIALVRFGANVTRPKVTLEVRDVQAIKL